MTAVPVLSPRQALILAFIGRRIAETGYPPTVREIGEQFKIKSPNGVMCHLKALQKKGLIERAANLSRGIRVVNAKPPNSVPEFLIRNATRYAMGRSTYAVAEMVDYLVEHWDGLSDDLRDGIHRDLEQEFARPKELQWLGMDMDRKQWERVRALWGGEPSHG